MTATGRTAQQPPAQVAALAQRFPGLVACCCMSYLQEGGEAAAAPAPAPGVPGRGGGGALPVEALPSTHADAAAPARAGAAAAGSGGARAAVPRITFLYKLVPGMADRSFGAHGVCVDPHRMSLDAAKRGAHRACLAEVDAGAEQHGARPHISTSYCCICCTDLHPPAAHEPTRKLS